MFSVLTSPACVTNCAEQSKPTNRNSRNGDMVCAIDFVRASSRSPSFLGGFVDACVGWRDSSEDEELDELGDRDTSSLDSREPLASLMVVDSCSMWCRVASRDSFSLDFGVYWWCHGRCAPKVAEICLRCFGHVLSMWRIWGFVNGYQGTHFCSLLLREHGMATWFR
jgi:hypothetical protein